MDIGVDPDRPTVLRIESPAVEDARVSLGMDADLRTVRVVDLVAAPAGGVGDGLLQRADQITTAGCGPDDSDRREDEMAQRATRPDDGDRDRQASVQRLADPGRDSLVTRLVILAAAEASHVPSPCFITRGAPQRVELGVVRLVEMGVPETTAADGHARARGHGLAPPGLPTSHTGTTPIQTARSEGAAGAGLGLTGVSRPVCSDAPATEANADTGAGGETTPHPCLIGVDPRGAGDDTTSIADVLIRRTPYIRVASDRAVENTVPFQDVEAVAPTVPAEVDIQITCGEGRAFTPDGQSRR